MTLHKQYSTQLLTLLLSTFTLFIVGWWLTMDMLAAYRNYSVACQYCT